jgi:hypothetical protein
MLDVMFDADSELTLTQLLHTAGRRLVLLPCAVLLLALSACAPNSKSQTAQKDLPEPQYYNSTGEHVSAPAEAGKAQQPRTGQQPQPAQQQASATPQPPSPDASPDKAISTKMPQPTQEACAEQLQDMCGAILLYLQLQIQGHVDPELPPTLPELMVVASQIPEFSHLKFTCPDDHEAYGYAPKGLIIPNDDARIIAWDTKAVHGKAPKYRWAIRVYPAIEGRPPSATVIPLTDEMFSKLRAP